MGTPFTHDMGEGAVSPAAIANPPPFARARSAVAYQGAARQIVQNLKYRDRTDLAPWMAAWMLRAGAELVRDADLVVPVPLHRRRFLWRRFNQSAELARHVARLAGLRYSTTAVLRRKPTRQQVGLAAKEREANVRGAFAVPDAADIDVRGRHILVVDDVFTTGATVSAVAKALKKGGASDVDILTFARALPRGGEPGDFLPGGGATI
jgi:ComF family protein